MSQRLESIERLCRDRGLRITGQRLVIARVVSEAQDHPDVPELHRRASAADSRISLATVYRTVKLFEDIGVIERHAFQDGRARYETTPAKHHDHLIDIATGQVIEFQSPEIEILQQKIAARLGYRLVGHKLELYAERISVSKKDAG
ncbi:MAG: Fur family transcriptional regulator [Beijerinckiaceae bacterium]